MSPGWLLVAVCPALPGRSTPSALSLGFEGKKGPLRPAGLCGRQSSSHELPPAWGAGGHARGLPFTAVLSHLCSFFGNVP